MNNYWKYNHLYEYVSSFSDMKMGNVEYIENLGEVDIVDETSGSFKKMKVDEFLKVCNDALYKFHRDYPYLFQFLAKCKVMYTPVYGSQICDTMCVDINNNLWINFNYVYNTCKMDSNRVFGILFHEMFHIFFDHLVKFNEVYPDSMFGGMIGAKRKANMKANICMDYEVNSSMVEDGVVDDGFWKRMNGLYKKEYAGMTWKEILDKYGDQEYKDWLKRNGFSLDDVELKVLDAIEKAAKVLNDPDAEEEEKRAARKELKKTLDDILGRKSEDGEKSIQDELEELGDSRLGDIGEMKMDIDDIVDDLYKDPSGMSSDELEKTLRDIDKLADDMVSKSEDIADTFHKDADEVVADAKKMKDALKKAMEKISKGGLTADEKEDLIDEAKDSIEDTIASEDEKSKLKEKRAARDAKKATKRLERFKAHHPFRAIILVLKNLADLKLVGRISDETVGILDTTATDLEPYTEKKLEEMTKDEVDGLRKDFNKMRDCIVEDMYKLIDNDVIITKTKDDLKKVNDDVFDYLNRMFDIILDKRQDDDAKCSVTRMGASKMRTLGKVLKTQKRWRVSDEFKEAYMKTGTELVKRIKEGDEEGVFKELWEAGVINPMLLDEHGKELLKKISGEVSYERKDDETAEGEYDHYDITKDDEVETYEGTVYYNIYVDDSMHEEGVTTIELSNKSDVMPDDWETYAPISKKFEIDFPDYILEEEMEATFSVYIKSEYKKSNYISPSADDLKKEISKNSDYVQGEWGKEE